MISRDALLKAAEPIRFEESHWIDLIYSQPTIDPVKHGRWMRTERMERR